MDDPVAPGDFREFLRSGSDVDVLELTRAREPAREIELDPADAGGVRLVNPLEADP